MFEKHYVLQVLKVFCSCFVNPLFLILACYFVGFSCFQFLLYLFLLLFHTSSFSVLVLVSVVLGFLGLFCVIFWICFFCFWFCFFFEGLRVKWGGPKGHLNWPQTLLMCFLLFLVVFCFYFLVLFFYFLQGLRVRWGCPKGDLTWP